MVIVLIPSIVSLVCAVDFLVGRRNAAILMCLAFAGVVSGDTYATALEYHVLASYFHILLVFLFKPLCDFLVITFLSLVKKWGVVGFGPIW